MQHKNIRRWKLIRTYWIGWTLAFIFLSIVRGEGTIEKGSVQFDLWLSIAIAFVFGPFFGSISAYAQILTEERIYGRMTIGRLFVFRFVYALLFLSGLIMIAYIMVTQFFGVQVGLMEFIFEPGSFAIYTYILVVDLFMLAVRQVSLMLGEGNLSKILLGRFYTPREEQRIFMFLDLQSSTMLAEELGHIRYSELIQDCFNDLGVVVEYGARIHQYVGDEAVLTWPMKDGLKNADCLRAFYAFQNVLGSRQEHYQERYAHVPVFKAGINGGLVTVTEVGKYKKEIAYHGDAINTTARIQAECNRLQRSLLISEQMKEQIETDDYKFEEMERVALKGKADSVLVHAVHKN